MKKKKSQAKRKVKGKRKVVTKTCPIIGYRRVSTDQQGESGLGLEAQDRNLASYSKTTGGRLLKTYTEVESGKRSDNRPELQKALAHAKRSGAVLAVGVLDRLSRN